MRLEGLAPTYSVDSLLAVGESDSIENQRVSTKFTRHPLPTSTFSMLPNQDWSVESGAHEKVYFHGDLCLNMRWCMRRAINYSEEVGFSGLTRGITNWRSATKLALRCMTCTGVIFVHA